MVFFFQSVDVRQIYDKFPEKKDGLKELYDKGPTAAFFLVKFWVGSILYSTRRNNFTSAMEVYNVQPLS